MHGPLAASRTAALHALTVGILFSSGCFLALDERALTASAGHDASGSDSTLDAADAPFDGSPDGDGAALDGPLDAISGSDGRAGDAGTPDAPAPALAQATTAGTNGSESRLTLTLPGPLDALGSSLLVAFVGVGDSSATVSPPSGWAVASDGSGHVCAALLGAGQQGELVLVHRAAPGEANGPFVFDFSVSSDYAIALVEVRHPAASSPIAGCAAESLKMTGGAVIAPTLTATARALPLVGYAPSTSGLAVTNSAGWQSTLYNGTATHYMTLDVEHHDPIGAGSITPSTTFSGAAGNIVYLPIVALLVSG